MQIANIISNSTIYGIGNRFVIWTQGCTLKCQGCWNKQMWSKTGGTFYTLDQILNLITNTPNIEGVTILGGEPFQQYPQLLTLAQAIHKLDLSLMIYTGYEIHELKEQNQTEIFAYTDILLTGRYEQNKRNTNLQWVGSDNQEIHFLSSRYHPTQMTNANYVEININEMGQIQMLGFPDMNDWRDIL
jgi:anaerobic ribonucleoside-triphosphate reductase activating protein